MDEVSIPLVSRAVAGLLTRSVKPVVYHDRVSGESYIVSPVLAAAASGWLPVLVVAGETIWREATGYGFQLDVIPDRDALLGYRLRTVGAGTFTTVMLATMEAIAQVTGPAGIVINDLQALHAAASGRIEHTTYAARRPAMATAS